MRKYNLPIFIPHRGCRHDCIFCNQRKITGVDTEVTPDDVRNRIKEFLSTVDEENSSVEVAFFGGSFTGLEMATQEAFLKVASEFKSEISGIRLSTRPDYINTEIIELLKKYNVTTVELGVQSSDDAVLEQNNRGHRFSDVKIASKLIKDAKIALGHQMMLGMYGSDPLKDMQTVRDIIKLSPDCVRIYPVITLKDTKLEKLFKDGVYKPYSVVDAAELSKNAVIEFKEAGIDVIRIGLHSSDDLEEDGGIVAGPYHQAFGEIVESLIFRDKMEEKIVKKNLSDCDFVFHCKKSEVSKAVGHKKMNSEYLSQQYNIQLKVKTD